MKNTARDRINSVMDQSYCFFLRWYGIKEHTSQTFALNAGVSIPVPIHCNSEQLEQPIFLVKMCPHPSPPLATPDAEEEEYHHHYRWWIFPSTCTCIIDDKAKLKASRANLSTEIPIFQCISVTL